MMFPFDARFLEVQNGVQVLLGVLLIVTFGYALLAQGYLDWLAYRDRVRFDHETPGIRLLWNTVRNRVRAIIALMVYFIGETGLRFWVWIWRHLENQQLDTTWMTHYPVLIFFGLISIAGALCVARIFSPDGWGKTGWIVGAVVAVGGALAFAF